VWNVATIRQVQKLSSPHDHTNLEGLPKKQLQDLGIKYTYLLMKSKPFKTVLPSLAITAKNNPYKSCDACNLKKCR